VHDPRGSASGYRFTIHDLFCLSDKTVQTAVTRLAMFRAMFHDVSFQFYDFCIYFATMQHVFFYVVRFLHVESQKRHTFCFGSFVVLPSEGAVDAYR